MQLVVREGFYHSRYLLTYHETSPLVFTEQELFVKLRYLKGVLHRETYRGQHKRKTVTVSFGRSRPYCAP
jgi:hypothetical protein